MWLPRSFEERNARKDYNVIPSRHKIKDARKSFTSQQWEKSVGHGRYDSRKTGQPRASEASRAIKAAKMFMPENRPCFLQILKKYNIVRNRILKIPTSFTDYKNGKLPRKVSLRDRYGNMWPIRVTKIGRDFYFQYGWTKFIEENTVEFGDVFIFDYDGNGTFDVKLLGITKCEKKGVGGLKLAVEEEEEINVEHQKSEEPKGENWASDRSSSSSLDDSDEDYRVEEDEDDGEDEGYEVAVEEKDENDNDDDDDDDEEEEGEKNEKSGTFKKASRSKAGCKRAIACKVRDQHDQFGADIFNSGHATQPKNPYFVAKIQSNRKYQMHVPINVVRDYKLVLPSSMTIRDSAGREFETKLKNWKNGRICLIGGWSDLYRCNLVEENDKCICEFVRGEHNKGLYLQVQVLHEGASSQPNKKNKK